MSDSIDEIEDGGPAFPKPGTDECIDVCGSQRGMSLRDWMAGQAMASINISEVLEAFRRNDYDGRQCHNVYVPVQTFAEIAKAAYEQADAMLAARKQVRG